MMELSIGLCYRYYRYKKTSDNGPLRQKRKLATCNRALATGVDRANGDLGFGLTLEVLLGPVRVCAGATRQRVVLAFPVTAGNKLLLLLFLLLCDTSQLVRPDTKRGQSALPASATV